MIKFTIFFVLLAAQMQSQRYVLNIQSYGIDKFQVYIDDVLQAYAMGLNYRIQGIPKGEKEMTLKIFSVPMQSVKIRIGSSGAGDEFYTLSMNEKKYSIVKNSESFRFGSGNMPVLGNYVTKRKPPVLDSNYKQMHTCEVTDSIVNSLIENLAYLENQKAKDNLVNSVLKTKCLLTYQIRALVARYDEDDDKLSEYKKYYRSCNDRNRYSELSKSFKSELAAQEFKLWLGKQ